ncbi:MAG: penicillin acylase family protein, partial [Candidatus Krumholzibacteriia bacterium]
MRTTLRSTPDLFPPRDRRRERRRRVLRIAGGVLITLLLALLAGGIWLRGRLSGSLPRLDGELRADGLGAAVTIERDALGIPTIRGESRRDVAFALGFLHAQERFFQMDLLRRAAAGELAELIGPAVLGTDRDIRVHRFRNVARSILLRMAMRELIDAYTGGVNAGLSSLSAPPFEYLLLRSQPRPWQAEDVVLAVLAMYIDLQPANGSRESAVGLLYDVLPLQLADFLAARGTAWDAPVAGYAEKTPSVPGPEVYDLRRQARREPYEQPRGAQSGPPGSSGYPNLARDPSGPPSAPAELGDVVNPLLGGFGDGRNVAGSNSWAVAGSRTADAGALLAGDMHLDLAVPNIWYRASMAYPDVHGTARVVTGVTLPGTPALVVGSNGDVAWTFTNSNVDASDLVLLDFADDAELMYGTADGPRALERHVEVIHVRGGEDDTLVVLESIWGPVVDRDHAGRMRVLRWVAHDDNAVNLGLVEMEQTRNIEEALEVANRTGIPAQNCVMADRSGRIAWTIMGLLPRRFGLDGRRPSSWADGSRGWDGTLTPAEYPRIVDPAEGRIWTANARVVDGEMLSLLGDGGYALGARAR